MPTNNLTEHIRELASELLADIELSRTTVTQQILKASRLARQVGDAEAIEWLAFETNGIAGTPAGRIHMSRTSRWTDKAKDEGYWGPVTDHEQLIQVLREEIQAARIESFSGDHLLPTTTAHRKSLRQSSGEVLKYSIVVNRVQSLLHEFARRTYYEVEFSEQQRELFDHARAEIDGMLAPRGGEALEKIDAIYRRLNEGDKEATSQAMNTCRRLIDSFADAVYPPQPGQTVVLNGTDVGIGNDKTLNRINAFAAESMTSKARRDRVRRNLADIYKRVNTGVHDDVTTTEARYLFLSTYVLLGELLSTSQRPSDVDPD